jgi:hypothetical protein
MGSTKEAIPMPKPVNSAKGLKPQLWGSPFCSPSASKPRVIQRKQQQSIPITGFDQFHDGSKKRFLQ